MKLRNASACAGLQPQGLKDRFFVLKSNVLFYYKSAKEREMGKEPIGFIFLEDTHATIDDGSYKGL